MSHASTPLDPAACLARIESAAANKLSASAVENLRIWLSEPQYAEYVPAIAEHVAAERWQELDDVFWTVIPFGTGGRRGRMYPIGCNAINDRTMGESAQGLAEYVLQQHTGDGPPRCAIAYDTRHRSREFAELCAEVMAGNGFQVHFLDGYRSTTELSVAVRHQRCDCGMMITASHNPPSDNAVKAYWSSGVQLLPPHDRGVIDRVMAAGEIRRRPFAEARQAGQIVFCQDEVDRFYRDSVVAQDQSTQRDVKILYSPMHGVGTTSVCPVLEAAGFRDVEVFGPHAEPSGDFPNVPDHVANPENPATFEAMIARAKQSGADLILSTDPDADRLGCAAPRRDGSWGTFTGNQIAVLLADYLLDSRRRAGSLTADHYVIKTMVTTEMVTRIADYYGVKTYGDLLVGFKWIGGLMDEVGPERFLIGIEESHGYLVGTYARDKDAAVAALLLSSLAGQLKADGQTLFDKLDALYWQFGYHAEKTISTTMPGSQGMARMQALMGRLRTDPPSSLGGLPVRQVRDYAQQQILLPDGTSKPLEGPQGDVVFFDLEPQGNAVAVRPSGTEPKVKCYLFTCEPPEQIASLDDTKAAHAERLAAYQRDIEAFVASV